MQTALVFVHYDGRWENPHMYKDYKVSGFTINYDCTYSELIEMIGRLLQVNANAGLVEVKYQVKDSYPPIVIDTDVSLQFYKELKRREADYTKFPLCITMKNFSDDCILAIDFPTDVQTKQLLNVEPSQFNTVEEMQSTVFSEIVAESMVQEAAATQSKLLEPISAYECNVTKEMATTVINNGQIFRNKELLKRAVSFYALKQQFQFKIVKSCAKQYHLKCIDDGCNWFVKASALGASSLFKIRSTGGRHTCSLDTRMNDQRQATSKIVADFIKSKLSDFKSKYTPADIIRDMKDEYGISLTYKRAWRSKRRALHELQGNPSDSYKLLPNYLELLVKTNPGSVVKISLTEKNKFQYLFMSLNASIKGWHHCRPIVIVDGTFLKASYGGTLLTACTQDANAHVLPLAFAVVDSENDDSYEWFFNQLKVAIAKRDGMCIVSDRHKSIGKAIEKVYPEASHCYCVFHLANNLKSTFKKNTTAVREAFMAAANAYTHDDFNKHINTLKTLDERVPPYLLEIGYEKWARVHCTTNRFLTMTSNAAEAVNSATKIARELPIAMLLETLRDLQQKWNIANRHEASCTFTTLAQRGHNMIKENYKLASRLSVRRASEHIYKVWKGTNIFVVDLQQRTCSCNKFQLDELPCQHALCVLRSINEDPIPFTSKYYLKETMLSTYQESVYPVEMQKAQQIPPCNSECVVLPPKARIQAGRPKKSRYTSGWEVSTQRRCSKCGNKGHNIKTCRNPPQ